MECRLNAIRLTRGPISIQADAFFPAGIHLISGLVGSGKSTLAEIIARVRRPDSGEVVYRDISRCILSMQCTEYHLTSSTMYGEVRSWGLSPAPVLIRAGLEGKDRDILTLSRGELKRLHLACVFSADPDLLILDEPYASLDPPMQGLISREVTKRGGRITILISHEITHLPPIDLLWEINEGILTCLGSFPGAFSGWKHPPALLTRLIQAGVTPENISRDALIEAGCRIQEYDSGQ